MRDVSGIVEHVSWICRRALHEARRGDYGGVGLVPGPIGNYSNASIRVWHGFAQGTMRRFSALLLPFPRFPHYTPFVRWIEFQFCPCHYDRLSLNFPRYAWGAQWKRAMKELGHVENGILEGTFPKFPIVQWVKWG